MNIPLWVSLLGLLHVVIAKEEDVVVLSYADFDDSIASREYTLVMFHAPWCGHCKQLAPQYAEAAELLPAGSLAKVDCTSEDALCSRFAIPGFPTLKLFLRDGTATEYNDARTTPALVRYVQKQGEPVYRVASTREELDAFLTETVTAVMFTPDDGEEGNFLEVARDMQHNDIAYVVAAEDLADDYGASMGQVIVITKFDGVSLYEGPDTVADLLSFIVEASFPLLGEIGPDNFQMYLDRGQPIGWLFLDYDNKNSLDVMEAVKEVALISKGSVTFVHLDGIKWTDHMQHFGVSRTPALVIEDQSSQQKYAFDVTKDHTDVDAIKEWVRSFISGDLVPSVRSEPPPDTNDGPVFKAVGSSFEALVQDPTKTVFIEFYAPWCGFCKALAPQYEQLGALFSDQPSVVIAAIDVTANEVDVHLDGFPTLILYPTGQDTDSIQYEGERSVTAMAEFIEFNDPHVSASATESTAAAGGGIVSSDQGLDGTPTPRGGADTHTPSSSPSSSHSVHPDHHEDL